MSSWSPFSDLVVMETAFLLGDVLEMLASPTDQWCILQDALLRHWLSVSPSVILWAEADERNKISERFESKYGLSGAVGDIDATPVVLTQKPAIDGEVYWTRKS